jgi:hypothetical protein
MDLFDSLDADVRRGDGGSQCFGLVALLKVCKRAVVPTSIVRVGTRGRVLALGIEVGTY